MSVFSSVFLSITLFTPLFFGILSVIFDKKEAIELLSSVSIIELLAMVLLGLMQGMFVSFFWLGLIGIWIKKISDKYSWSKLKILINSVFWTTLSFLVFSYIVWRMTNGRLIDGQQTFLVFLCFSISVGYVGGLAIRKNI